MSQNLRSDPKLMYGIPTKFMAEMLTGDEERINKALLSFNEELMVTSKFSLQPLKMVNSELNKLKLVASEKLLPKIDQYKKLVTDYSNEYQTILASLSSTGDLQDNAEKLQSIGHEARGKQLTEVWQEIESLMRDEIGYYKK